MSSGKKSFRCERKASGEKSSSARSVATASGASAAFSSRCRAAEGDTAAPPPRSANQAGQARNDTVVVLARCIAGLMKSKWQCRRWAARTLCACARERGLGVVRLGGGCLTVLVPALPRLQLLLLKPLQVAQAQLREAGLQRAGRLDGLRRRRLHVQQHRQVRLAGLRLQPQQRRVGQRALGGHLGGQGEEGVRHEGAALSRNQHPRVRRNRLSGGCTGQWQAPPPCQSNLEYFNACSVPRHAAPDPGTHLVGSLRQQQ